MERQVKLFRNGRNQALRIPREFELPGSDAILRKEGDKLIILPCPRPSLIEVLDGWRGQPLNEDETFPEIDDPQPRAVNL